MKPIQRIKQYMDFKGISLNAFDKAIGASNGYIGKQIKNGASIGVNIIEKILRVYTDLNPDWLIMGKNEMIRPNKRYDNEGISMVEENPIIYNRVGPCDVCKEKDKRINDLLKQIEYQHKMLEKLTNK